MVHTRVDLRLILSRGILCPTLGENLICCKLEQERRASNVLRVGPVHSRNKVNQALTWRCDYLTLWMSRFRTRRNVEVRVISDSGLRH